MNETAAGVTSESSEGSQTSGRWTEAEHQAFLTGLRLYGREWKKVAGAIKTRTSAQIRSHAQKYFAKLAKDRECGEGGAGDPGRCAPVEPREVVRQLLYETMQALEEKRSALERGDDGAGLGEAGAKGFGSSHVVLGASKSLSEGSKKRPSVDLYHEPQQQQQGGSESLPSPPVPGFHQSAGVFTSAPVAPTTLLGTPWKYNDEEVQPTVGELLSDQEVVALQVLCSGRKVTTAPPRPNFDPTAFQQHPAGLTSAGSSTNSLSSFEQSSEHSSEEGSATDGGGTTDECSEAYHLDPRLS